MTQHGRAGGPHVLTSIALTECLSHLTPCLEEAMRQARAVPLRRWHSLTVFMIHKLSASSSVADSTRYSELRSCQSRCVLRYSSIWP